MMVRPAIYLTGCLMVLVAGCGYGGTTYYALPAGTIPQGQEPCYLYGPARPDNNVNILAIDG